MKHSIICFISLMMTVFVMQELQSISFQSIQLTGKSITCKEKNTIEKGSCKNLYRTTKSTQHTCF